MKTLYDAAKRAGFMGAVLLSLAFPAVSRENDGAGQCGREAEVIEVEIDGAVGKLAGIVCRPGVAEGETVPMVILMHGFMSDKQSRVIGDIAEKLMVKGIASIRFDFNGHGESDGEFGNMTVANEIEDAAKVYEYVRSLDFVGSVALLGHSQGGVVASMLAGELGAEKVASLVLMAPAAVLRDDALNGVMFGVRYNPQDIPEFVPVSGRRVGREYVKVAQALPIYETAALYCGPVCIIHGMSDDIVPYSYSVRYKDGYKDAVLHLVEGEDHGFSAWRDEVTDIAVQFLAGPGK